MKSKETTVNVPEYWEEKKHNIQTSWERKYVKLTGKKMEMQFMLVGKVWLESSERSGAGTVERALSLKPKRPEFKF